MELNFANGVQSYTVNGVKDALRLNPADAEMLRKVYLALKDLEGKQKEQAEAREKSGDIQAVFDRLHALDQEMRGVLDGLFGDGLCEKIFGEMSLYALADGFPVWENFLLAVIDLFDDSVKREAALSDKRIQKHVQKYHR
nr:MAG TPA: tail assembly chaperone [Caudoviricetes sp.]